MSDALYSIVTPVYKTEAFLEELLAEIDKTMKATDIPYEIICVNDCSPDKAWEKLKSIKANSNYPLRLVNLSRNFGQHKAILCGLAYSKGFGAVVIDSDLQYSPGDIPKLIEAHKKTKADVVYGIFDNKKHASWRNYGSRTMGFLLNKFGAFSSKGSSFKLIDRKLVKTITDAGFEYVFIDEMISWFTDKFAYVEVKHLERQDGNSSYNVFSLAGMSLRIILNYTALPLRIMTYFGLFAAIICFSLGVVFIYRWAVWDVPMGFTATIVIVTFGFSVTIFCLGIIGDYLRRIYFTLLKKPSFTIKEFIE